MLLLHVVVAVCRRIQRLLLCMAVAWLGLGMSGAASAVVGCA